MLTISPRLKRLLPPLQAEERSALEASLVAEGCRYPLVVWQTPDGSVLVDGHNRYEICARLGLSYETREIEFDGIEAVEDWIDRNQLARRNLSPDVFRLVLGRHYNRLKKAAGAQPGNRNAAGPEKQLRQIGAVESNPNISDSDTPAERTSAKVGAEYGVSPRTVERAGAYAEAVDKLDLHVEVTSGEPLPYTRAQVVDAARSLPPDATPKDVAETKERLKKPHVANNSGNNEWYTPSAILEAARKALGGIDLDPASCATANANVRATRFYTAEEDGLSLDWHGCVWLNPPYERGLVEAFIVRVCGAREDNEIEAACVLVNNGTETKAGQLLLKAASAACFIAGRVKFLGAAGEPAKTPLQGQMVAYLGNDPDRFARAFEPLGTVLFRLHIDTAVAA